MPKGKRLIFPILILLFLVALLISGRSFLTTYIAEPVAILGWVVWRIIESVDQNIYWVLLIVLCSMLVVRFALIRMETFPSSAYLEPEMNPARLGHWQRLIKEAGFGKSERQVLEERLLQLLLDSVGGQDDLKKVTPPRIQKLINSIGRKRSMVSQFLYSIFPRWFRSWVGKFVSPDYIMIDEILSFIETEMEIPHENSS
ncbi:MAG: hypothetical protein ISR58_19600 [Anaerolineales bacterium]|nr:hypothetical protein [Chloroflexota bacterium]MBL6983390.1 hypothetical protein [Anaerolineales bacterium]